MSASAGAVPDLAAAGIGLLVGDLTVATAILRPDYSTGTGMGVSLELLRDIAAAASHGVLIRDASAFEHHRLRKLILFDHVPALEQVPIKVASVESRDGTAEADILRLCAAAYRDLGDQRAFALQKACATNRIAPLDVVPGYRGEGITFEHGRRAHRRAPPRLDLPRTTARPLEVSCDGRPVGIVTFGFADELHALEAIQELRRHDTLPIGLVSDRADDVARSLAAALGFELHAAGMTSEAKRETRSHHFASAASRRFMSAIAGGIRRLLAEACRRSPSHRGI